jgi:hypothetical protein
MSQNCPNCGTVNRSASRFCSNCGAALAALAVDGPNVSDAQQGEAQGTAPEGPSEPGVASGAPPREGVAEGATYVVRRWEGEPDPSPSEAPTLPIGASTSADEAFPAYIPPPLPTRQRQEEQLEPGLAVRRGGEAYAPYSAEAVASIEDSRRGRSWLVPVIVVAALSLGLLGAVSGYLLLQGRGTSPQAVSGQPTKTGTGPMDPLPPNASEEDKVKQVVRQSNEEQITAWRELDTEVLKGTRIGDVLKENIEMVEALKAHGMYAIPENQRLDILEVKIQGDTATVRTIEVWTVSFYKRSDNSLIEAKGPDTFTETYYLVKQDGKWMVNKLDIDEEKDKGTPSSSR